MIDINELRRKANSTDIVDHIDLHANIKPFLSEILDRLEAAENDVALKERVIDALGSELNAVANERDALRAKIEQMEKQDPVAHVWRCDNGQFLGLSERFLPMGTKLYALPGAKGEEK